MLTDTVEEKGFLADSDHQAQRGSSVVPVFLATSHAAVAVNPRSLDLHGEASAGFDLDFADHHHWGVCHYCFP